MKIWLPAIRAGTGADTYAELLATGVQQRGMQVKTNWYSRWYELFPPLLRFIPAPGADITITNSVYGYGFKRKDIKLVVTVYHCVHAAAYTPYRSIGQKIYHDTLLYFNERRSLQVADKVVAISYYTAASIKQTFTACDPIVIYPGIDTALFSPGTQSPCRDKFRLLFVGSPSRRKGFDLLVPIMRRLGDRFTLGVTGNQRPDRHGEVNSIRALGRLTNTALLQAYRDCDALLFPTRLEGFGYAAAEAMACGKPVITSDNSSLPELVQHNETGLLCPTDNVDAFVQAARLLADNPDQARRMGEVGRERVLHNFTLEQMTEHYLRLFEETLAPRA